MAEWFVEPDPANPPAHPHGFSPTMRHDEQRANSLGIIIITSLFFVLFAAALMVGGHATIGPLLRSAADTRGGPTTGDIVVRMPDGVLCRHMSLDNITGDITQGQIKPCPADIATRHAPGRLRFEWGTH
jgi:hypothetical protein